MAKKKKIANATFTLHLRFCFYISTKINILVSNWSVMSRF